MQIKNVSPAGDLDLPLIGRVVKAGEIITVTDEHGQRLADQPRNWAIVPVKNEKKDESE